jgi:hypothetical protein
MAAWQKSAAEAKTASSENGMANGGVMAAGGSGGGTAVSWRRISET